LNIIKTPSKPLNSSDFEEIRLARFYATLNSSFPTEYQQVSSHGKFALMSVFKRLFVVLKNKVPNDGMLFHILKKIFLKMFLTRFSFLFSENGLNQEIRPGEILYSKDIGFGILTSDVALVTIVIPVHNHWWVTYKCLRALQRNSDVTPYEVIVVDDASSDSTTENLDKIRGIRVIRSDTNIGYLRATNLGVDNVGTKYLILLNNDTEPLSGWIDSLVAVAENDEKIAVVGSTLVYPDGTLQESGGQVFSNGNAWNLGRGSSYLTGQYLIDREVDYCSAASLLVKTSFWREIGGFNELFAPAYYEDTDICMSAWKCNYKVVLSSTSVVIHHEGVSHGKEVNSGIKIHQTLNKEVFRTKWKVDLQYHWEDLGIPRLERLRNSKGIIVIIDEQIPSFSRDSGSIRTIRLAEILREDGYHVIIGALVDNISSGHLQYLRNQGFEVHLQLSQLFDSLTVRKKRVKAFWLVRTIVAETLILKCKDLVPTAKIITDLLDLDYRYNHKGEVVISPKQLEIASISENLALVSPYECGLLQSQIGHIKISDYWKYFDPQYKKAPSDNRRDILFVGSFRHAPNLEGIMWFASEVIPQLHKIGFDQKINVVGAGLEMKDRRFLESLGVSILGHQENLRDLYESHAVSIVPLLSGRGLKGKLAEALSFGVPVVSTGVGIEGFQNIKDYGICLSDTPEGFAREIQDLLTQPDSWTEKSDLGLSYIENFFGRERMSRKVRAILDLDA
jgi:GT2 family glycosyltransferase